MKTKEKAKPAPRKRKPVEPKVEPQGKLWLHLDEGANITQFDEVLRREELQKYLSGERSVSAICAAAIEGVFRLQQGGKV